jgi:prophage DNA circulation protein
MSGVLSALAAVNALFGGYGIVTLGPVQFQGQEVPDVIQIGGGHSLKIHKLPGGQRVIDAMGRDDCPLTWSGVMFGPGSEQRMLLLDSLRVSGTPITLAFGTMSYTVVVSEFKGDYRRTNWCGYSITCEVVADNSAAFASFLPSGLQQITNDVGSALSAVSGGLPAITSLIGSAQTALAVTGAISQGTAAFSAATSLLGVAQTAVTGGIASTGAVLSGLASGAAGILGTGVGFSSTASAIGNMASAVTNAGNLGGLVNAAGFLSRGASNLGGDIDSLTGGQLFSGIGNIIEGN